MALISDERMRQLASRKFICAVCDKPVDTWERWNDPSTAISGLRFYCHGSTDTAEIGEAMLLTGRFKTIVPFRREAAELLQRSPQTAAFRTKNLQNLARTDLGRVLKLARSTDRPWDRDDLELIRPLCACGNYVKRTQISPVGSVRQVTFSCHDQVWTVLVEEVAMRSQLFPKALANFRPFTADKLFGEKGGATRLLFSEGVSTGLAGESVKAGQLVAMEPDGRLRPATSGDVQIGVALGNDTIRFSRPGDNGATGSSSRLLSEITNNEGEVVGRVYSKATAYDEAEALAAKINSVFLDETVGRAYTGQSDDPPPETPKPKEEDDLMLPRYGSRKIDLTDE